MVMTVVFYPRNGYKRPFTVTKKVNDKRHADNFISYMEKKGYVVDEIYTDQNK